MAAGLTYSEACAVPVGELLDLMAIYRIKHEGAQLATPEDEDIIPDIL